MFHSVQLAIRSPNNWQSQSVSGSKSAECGCERCTAWLVALVVVVIVVVIASASGSTETNGAAASALDLHLLDFEARILLELGLKHAILGQNPLDDVCRRRHSAQRSAANRQRHE
jgi:hypothetical protein